MNIFKKLRFKKEAVIVFANLGKNNKAYRFLDEYINLVALISYTIGIIIGVGLVYLFSILL